MALQYTQKPEKYGGYRITIPNQKAYVITHDFRGDKFNFFEGRGCVVGKGLKPSFDSKGTQVTDYGIDDVLKHFEEKGFKITDLDKKKQTPPASQNNADKKDTKKEVK